MGRSILLLKETSTLGQAIQDLLEACGHRVLPATSVREALREARLPSKFDALVDACNYQFSGLLQELKMVRLPPHGVVPILVVGRPRDWPELSEPWPVVPVPLPLTPSSLLGEIERLPPREPQPLHAPTS
jgi:hypothetical protein